MILTPNLKVIFCTFVLVCLQALGSVAWAIDVGILNVFTDLPEAVIVVDGLVSGRESVVKLPLEVGEHYVEVLLDGKTAYAEKVVIQSNRSTTVLESWEFSLSFT